MSITKLSRERGMWISCNGTGDEGCPSKERVYSANVMAKHNRPFFAKSAGWGRGLRGGYKRRDLCPSCVKLELELHTKAETEKAAEKIRRRELKGSRFAGTAPTKKRKRPAATESTPPATGSPSVDSAPAPAT